jgi:hypothetical protein
VQSALQSFKQYVTQLTGYEHTKNAAFNQLIKGYVSESVSLFSDIQAMLTTASTNNVSRVSSDEITLNQTINQLSSLVQQDYHK